MGTLTQGALEASNVDIGGETIRLEKLEQWRAALLRAMKMPG